MFFRMMTNCNMFEIENENFLYEELIKCRNKLHHSANSRIPQSEAKTHLDTMTALLEKFENVPACSQTVSKLNKVRNETIMSISVPNINIRKMAKEVLELKKSFLEVEKEINKSKGLSDDETNSELEDTINELENIDDPEKPLSGTKSREDYKREIQEYKAQVKKLESENKVLKIQRNRQTEGNKDEVISGKVKDPQKYFENMTSLLKAYAHNPEIADALSDINPLLYDIVEAASKSDEKNREQFEEISEQETSEQETRADIDRRQKDNFGDSVIIASNLLKDLNQDSNRPVNREPDKDTDSVNTARFQLPPATTIVAQVPGTRLPHVWSVASKQSYNIKMEQEEHCDIWGCCQSPTDEILLADTRNSRLKKLNARYEVVGVCDLPYSPCDVCCFGNNTSVVSSFDKHLQFVDVASMTLTRSVKTVDNCYGLTCHDMKLYVLTTGGVCMYHADGTKQRIMYSMSWGVNFIPWHSIRASQCRIAMNDVGSKIYITTKGSLITIDSSGNHLFTLTDQELNGSLGVCVDGVGHVLVCNFQLGGILQVSHDGKHILGTIEKLSSLEAILFDRHKSTLTCAGFSNDITVLQLKQVQNI